MPESERNLPAPRPNPREVLEGLNEEVIIDYLGLGAQRKPHVTFTPERQVLYLRHLIRSGRICDSSLVAGVSYESVRRMRVNDKKFARAEEAAQELHNDLVRALIAERAEHGSVERTFEAEMVYASRFKLRGSTPEDMEVVQERGLSREMVLTKEVYRKSDAMLLAYAKSRMPEFREKGDVIAHNATGGVLVVNPRPSSSEDWEEKWANRRAVDAEHEVIEEPPEEKDENGTK